MGSYERIADPGRTEGRQLVFKREEGQDPRSLYGTTYQMRNFYKQFADGFFSSLDVMNYIQHHAAVMRMKKGDRVLDVCCGRGLLLPLIRWYRKNISEYVGVDISETNINEQLRWSGAKKFKNGESVQDYYPFGITHVLCSCEDMGRHLEHGSFDRIVYTSAIEHMQKKAGFKSLRECYKLLKSSGELFLSCPNTQDKKDPYDTQYAAHLYEWDLNELTGALDKSGFMIVDSFGLVGKVRDYEAWLQKHGFPAEKNIYQRLSQYLPKAWLMALFPILHPDAAAEVLLICKRKDGTLF